MNSRRLFAFDPREGGPSRASLVLFAPVRARPRPPPPPSPRQGRCVDTKHVSFKSLLTSQFWELEAAVGAHCVAGCRPHHVPRRASNSPKRPREVTLISLEGLFSVSHVQDGVQDGDPLVAMARRVVEPDLKVDAVQDVDRPLPSPSWSSVQSAGRCRLSANSATSGLTPMILATSMATPSG